MPTLDGRFIPVLRVSDVVASAVWYSRVLCLIEVSRYGNAAGTVMQVVLEDPRSGLTLALVAPDGAGALSPFDERLLGLDHLELLVSNVDELSRWVDHFDAQSVLHSGIKAPDYSRAAMVTFRDEDNIQLELFCPER